MAVAVEEEEAEGGADEAKAEAVGVEAVVDGNIKTTANPSPT